TLTVGDLELEGMFRFEQAPDETGARRTVLAATGLEGSLGPITLVDGAGVLLLSDTGAAGFISVRATGGGSSGTGILTINSTGVDIDTVVTVGGRTIPITIAAGIGTDPRVDFTLAEGVLDVGGFVTITGSLTFTN